MAVAIGYDWLFDRLSPDARRLVQEAILNKGFAPSRDKIYNWFLRATNNLSLIHIWEIFQAIACSRPPEPNNRMFISLSFIILSDGNCFPS